MNAEICIVEGKKETRIQGQANYCIFQSFGSEGTTIAFRQRDGSIWIKCGCFYGTLEEFERRVERTHGNNKFRREYKAIIRVIKIKFEIKIKRK